MEILKNTCIYILFLFPSLVVAQLQKQVSFSQLSVNEGLSQNSVVSIAQDSTGYLWFATQDGLNKYDGRTFTYYSKFYEDITRENYSKLGKIYCSATGSIYSISINDGLEQYSTITNKFKPIPKFSNPSTILDTHDQLWVATFGNGAYVVNRANNDTIQVLRGADTNKFGYHISTFKNDITIASDGGIYLINRSTLAYEKLSANTSYKISFSSMATGTENTLWAGTFGNGLYFKNDENKTLKKFEGFDLKNTIPTNLNIQTLLFDSKNRLWIGTYGDGAYRLDLDNKVVEHFTVQQYNPQALHYNDVLCLYEDYTGVIWLGTDGGGLSYYDENLSKFNQLTNFQTPTDVNVDVTRAIAQDSKNTLWIGTSGKGLTSYNTKKNIFKSYKLDPNRPNGIPSNRIMSLLTIDHTVWIGFQNNGLSILDKAGRFKNFNSNSSPALPAETIWCMLQDSNKRVWLGTREAGLIQFDPEKGVIHQYNGDSSPILNNIRVLYEGDKEMLWIGTENDGLLKFDPNTGIFVKFQLNQVYNIKSLYYEAPYLWIGTNGNGLQRFNTETEQLTSYTSKDLLPNNVIYGILPDSKGNLWLSSNRGITRFYLTNPDDIPKITNYDIYDGLQAMEFNTGASYEGKDGNLYFGGLNGINWFNPEFLSGNLVPPKTVINKLELFAEEIPLENHRKFSARQNTISFTFAGLHFSQPQSNLYKYQLQNYETNWSAPSTNNFAHYPNLPAGNYTFKVLSSNYEGIWDDSPATYNFNIQSPWYLTTVAKLGYALFSILLLFGIYYYLKSRWKMQLQLQLEHEETERLTKLDELKSKLYTNISHEFRTPLTLISAPVQQLIASSSLQEKDKKSLKIIEGSSQRMLRLVNQLLDLSKLEKGVVQLKVGRHDLKPQILQLLEAFSLRANEKGINIKSEIDDKHFTITETWYDRDAMEKIISNLLSNAVKYAPENSKVIFKAKLDGNVLKMTTINDNNTLTTKEIDHLFERFYQVDKNAQGVGVGLAIIKELATLSNGSVQVVKENKETISFIVEIPIAKSNYNINNISEELKSLELIPPAASPIFETELDNTPQILIVEDNAEIRSYIVSLFNENCMVSEAKDGLEGIKMAIDSIPDLIISDIMMPKKDGIELCNTLKTDTRTSHIPIILLTAKTGDTSELEGLQNKADDYITKPFNAAILAQKATNIINLRRKLRERYSQNLFLKPKDIAITPVDETFLEDVDTILDTHLTNPTFNAEKFAGELHMSRMQLHRKMKALTGLSTSEFLRIQRLRAAVPLLEKDITINEVAYSVGFNTPSYFIKCFKEVYGNTPSEYVKKD